MTGQLCAIDGCTREAKRGDLCWGHLARRTRGQGMSELKRRPETPFEVVSEAALEYANCDEYASQEAFGRARDNLRKASARYGLRYLGEATREGLAAARERGVQLGRPRRLVGEQAQTVPRLVQELGGVRAVARALGVSRDAVRSALRSEKGDFRPPGTRPRSGRR